MSKKGKKNVAYSPKDWKPKPNKPLKCKHDFACDRCGACSKCGEIIDEDE